MLDLILLILFIAGLITGARRGLIVQLIHMVGFVVAMIVAYVYYKPLAEKFVLWIPYPAVDANSKLTIALDHLDVDQTFYQLIAFVLIFMVVKFALQLVASAFDFLKYFPVLGTVNRVLGAILGFAEFYIIVFFILYVLALLPTTGVQSFVSKSFIASLMLEHTPIMSSMVKNWWYIYLD